MDSLVPPALVETYPGVFVGVANPAMQLQTSFLLLAPFLSTINLKT